LKDFLLQGLNSISIVISHWTNTFIYKGGKALMSSKKKLSKNEEKLLIEVEKLRKINKQQQLQLDIANATITFIQKILGKS
jgi:hypothetical protein